MLAIKIHGVEREKKFEKSNKYCHKENKKRTEPSQRQSQKLKRLRSRLKSIISEEKIKDEINSTTT